MVLFSLVASHADIDLETVARLSAGASKVASTMLADNPEILGAVAVATCNRYEIYAEARSADEVEAARAAVVARISNLSGLTESTVSRAFDTRRGEAVSAHLFAVSAGLDSAVVGEREIAGQVRRALIGAQQDGTASPALIRLFQAASKTAKDVGAQTALGSRGLSIVSVALDLAAEIDDSASAGDFGGKKAVIFGTGAYAGATMAKLAERGCTDIAVFSSSGRAEAFVASRGGTALTSATLPDAVADADLMIGCSGSDHRVEAGDIDRVRRTSRKPLIIIDLALTRDFDPAVNELPDVELLTLESVRMAAPQEQAQSLSQASSIVSEAARSFEARQNERSVDGAIVALRRHTLSVLDTEIERVRAQHGCTAAAEEVEFAMRRMVKSLLHIPTVRARELAATGEQESYFAGLEALYGITVEQPMSAGAAPAGSADLAARDCPVLPAEEAPPAAAIGTA
ncbi:glutamyl-tRNA reductase [Paenarthrobacter sp. Z7-10]|uniref:glutamyl-tRNA reductase n=1 Tax=Paenarthrobacter sp. Z7-10 TaxID=2787635 RepID=UPI0022A911CA|nr:glutamyl-tRNA reductase [Paenarthrobacter sp. Z7-10]MCZ2403218.1 glutamyl-tRNA reductase [Paenarthrobacter sp. Z7-10]